MKDVLFLIFRHFLEIQVQTALARLTLQIMHQLEMEAMAGY